MATRYQKQDGPWHEVARESFRADRADTDTDEVVTVTIESSDMLDHRSGHRYVGGARRVRCSNSAYGRTKTFLGEMAWADSNRYATDIATKVTRSISAIFAFSD